MIPDPLHPAIVHLPIVLRACLPLAGLGALWSVRRGAGIDGFVGGGGVGLSGQAVEGREPATGAARAR